MRYRTMTHFFRSSLLAVCAVSVCTLASAKLPAPSPEAAAKAAEAAAKTAWAGKVDNYKLCLAQDKVAAHYRKTQSAAKPATPTTATTAVSASACADPGPFAYTPPEAKPLEASGAHSPPGKAIRQPSTVTQAAATA